MEKATKLIAELKHKVKEYEMKFTEPSPLRLLTTELDVDMIQDTKMSEISSQAMRDQIRFFTEKLESTSKELEEKEMIIDKIEMEKRELMRKSEFMELG
jgi:hypothetical protein